MVPIDRYSRQRFTIYYPYRGSPRFCMDWVGRGRCRKFCKTLRSLYPKRFRQRDKAQRALWRCRKRFESSHTKFWRKTRGNVPQFVFCPRVPYGGDRSFYEYTGQFRPVRSPYRNPRSKIRPGSAGINSRSLISSSISRIPVLESTTTVVLNLVPAYGCKDGCRVRILLYFQVAIFLKK